MVALRGRFWALLELIPNIAMAAVVIVGGWAVADERMSLGSLVAFTTLLVLLQWPIIDIGWILAMTHEAATAGDRFFEVLDTVPAVSDPPHPVPLVRAKGRLAFEEVSFRFPDAERPTLAGIDLVL